MEKIENVKNAYQFFHSLSQMEKLWTHEFPSNLVLDIASKLPFIVAYCQQFNILFLRLLLLSFDIETKWKQWMQRKSCRFLFDLRLSAVLIFLLLAIPHYYVAVNVLLVYSIWNRKIVFKVKEIHSQNQLSTIKKAAHIGCSNSTRYYSVMHMHRALPMCVCV